MAYELKREDIFDFASSRNATTHEHGEELEFELCPYCAGGDNGRDKKTFSINMRTGLFKCFRSTCGKQGHFVQLCRDFDFPLDYDDFRTYKKLPQRRVPILPEPEALTYLASRGISKETAERYEITVRNDRRDVLVFPFFDENGILKFVKYRNTNFIKGETKGSKEWSEKDTEPILFGMKQCVKDDFSRLIITEGQIDSLSVEEAGIHNAVSVPTGAMGFTWVKSCRNWIEKFSEIIVFGDHEHDKITLVDGLMARLPNKIKVVQAADYLDCKDANEILQKYGKGQIATCIENAKEVELKNVKRLAECRSIDLNSLEHISSGVKALDRTIEGICAGDLILLTGKRGEGKSTFMSQMICDAIDQGQTTFVYSGELPDFQFKRWLDLQLAGSLYIEEYENSFGARSYTISEDTVQKISAWYYDKIFIYDNGYIPDGNSEMESLPKTIENVITKYGATFICIDNLMVAMDLVKHQDDLYLAQSNFVGELKKIALKYQVMILLVAHPKKKSSEGFDNDDVSGSSDITNKADIVLNYSKPKPNSEEVLPYDSLLQIAKNRHNGHLLFGDDAIQLKYSEKSKRIWESASNEIKHYGWETVNGSDSPDDESLPF